MCSLPNLTDKISQSGFSLFQNCNSFSDYAQDYVLSPLLYWDKFHLNGLDMAIAIILVLMFFGGWKWLIVSECISYGYFVSFVPKLNIIEAITLPVKTSYSSCISIRCCKKRPDYITSQSLVDFTARFIT